MIRWARWIGVITLGVATWGACRQDDIRAARWSRFQCPEGSVEIAIVTQGKGGQDSILAVFDDIPLSHPVATIPEYHDCQRFIQGDRYVSLFAIFAAFRLDTIDTLAHTVSAPMATVYTPDGTYSPLGIQTGFNCLFLARSSSGTWTAKMIPWGIDRNNCADGHITPSPGVGMDLAVRADSVDTKFSANDFPPVARWDRDSLDRQYTIGIRCGRAWCTVGQPGFAPSVGYSGPPLTFERIGAATPSTLQQRRVQAIKGWYDVQRLALPLTGGAIGPTGFRGYLIPHPLLDSLAWLKWTASATASLDSFHGLGWIHVGYAVMEGDYPKWGYSKGRNKIYMCYGTLGDKCTLPNPLPTQEQPSILSLDSCPADPTNAGRRWWAKTVSESGHTTYVCIKRMSHRDALMTWVSAAQTPSLSFSIPATARWRFMPVDESSWFGCPTGCCTKQ